MLMGYEGLFCRPGRLGPVLNTSAAGDAHNAGKLGNQPKQDIPEV